MKLAQKMKDLAMRNHQANTIQIEYVKSVIKKEAESGNFGVELQGLRESTIRFLESEGFKVYNGGSEKYGITWK